MEGEIPTRIISLDTHPNTGDNNQMGLDMIYET